MADIAKIDRMPAVKSPVEGVDYIVVVGVPQDGDHVRITTAAGVQIFENTYTGPTISPVVAATLAASGFQDVCETGFGGGATGASRFGAVMRALATSNDDLVYSINQRFLKSTTFDKTKAAAMFTILVAKTVLTAQERTAILAAWP